MRTAFSRQTTKPERIMGGFQMATMIKVPENLIDHTRGYGNTQDSYTFTMGRILDNSICDADLERAVERIITATLKSEIWPDADPEIVLPDDMNGALLQVMLEWATACPDYYAGMAKFMAKLSFFTAGDLNNRMPVLEAWEWMKVAADNPDAKPRKRRKAA